jgi:hypothetical protein
LALAHAKHPSAHLAGLVVEPREAANQQEGWAEADKQRQQRITGLVERAGIDLDPVLIEQ